ncbi:MAG: AzlD domain-containing protein [Candidatus Hodarchaeales archaeon]
MNDAELLTHILLILFIGCFTYSFRAVFLFKYPGLFNKSLIRKGLESVSSSLLVALVIPFTFFVGGKFIPLRNEVYAVLLAVLILWYLKKPGLSLIITIICLFGLNFAFNII